MCDCEMGDQGLLLLIILATIKQCFVVYGNFARNALSNNYTY